MSFVLFTSALGLGFLHGLGADHLMAIAALSADGRHARSRTHVVQTAFGFAVGHTLVLGLGATAAILFGIVLPEAVTSGAERIGGAILIVLGAVGLWTMISGRAYTHMHREADGQVRLHLHVDGPPPAAAHAAHAHSAVPTLMGAVFAFSSLRALMLLQPFGDQALALTLPVLLMLIALFGLGILLSMSLFGVLLARLFSLAIVQQLGRLAAALVAVASIALGAYWLM